MKTRYELAWNETSFISKLKYLSAAKKKFGESMIEALHMERDGVDFRIICEKQARAHSSLSSAHYSVKGTARAHIAAFYRPLWLIWLLPVRIIAWGLLGWWCHKKDIEHSNAWVAHIGYSRSTAPMCDVRQSVLRSHGEYGEALVCILVGLSKNPSKIARCLLLVGLADVALNTDDLMLVVDSLDKALVMVSSVKSEDPRQAARVFRAAARITERIEGVGAASWMKEEARILASGMGAKDQLLKQRR